MSTGLVHQPDTPVSSGSPSSVGIETAGTCKLDCLDKNDELIKSHEGSCCSSPLGNDDCRSGSSSPPTITPNLSFTPPSNGLLTPPNDADIGNDSVKSDKGSGRLKFYKDGVLCLELSHNDEGEKRKWVQIRTKTVFPTVVHTKKEVVIPRHVSPSPSFHSPLSVTNSLQQRLESSASHSTSDDGSSMLSSPRIRESSWRKPVPCRNKGISSRLEFYLKPGRCILKFRQYSKFYQSKRYRKSCYKSNETTISLQDIPSLKCSCDISPPLEYECETAEDTYSSCGKAGNGYPVSSILLKTMPGESKKPTKSSILELVQKLHSENEKHLKLASAKLYNRIHDYNDRKGSGTDQPTLPKKRSYREAEMNDLPPFRPCPTKLSPKSKSVKTILNIPGFNNEFSPKRTNTSDANDSDRPLVNNNHDRKTIKNDISTKKKSCRAPKLESATNYASSNSNNSVKIPRRSTCSPKQSPTCNNFPMENAMYLSSLPPEQQQIFQQQTMSKAISYTINSLLSPHIEEPPRNSSVKPQGKDKTKIAKRELKNEGSHILPVHQSNYFGIKGEHDQNSFLRHLLDTSDPIPNPTAVGAAKPEVSLSNNKIKQSQPASGSESQPQSHSHQSTQKDNMFSSRKLNACKSKEKLPVSGGRNVITQPPQLQHQQIGFFPPAAFLQPSLFGGGFPMHMQGYESLFGGQNASVGALAVAAAELQYQSLLPPNFLPMNMNPSMAAAMAATYLGASPMSCGLPPISPSSNSMTSSRSPPTSRRSDNYPSNRNASKSMPINLSQRELPSGSNGVIPGRTSIPVPFHAPNSDNSPHSGSASRTASSRGRLVKAHDIVDDDLPLNLSKKT